MGTLRRFRPFFLLLVITGPLLLVSAATADDEPVIGAPYRGVLPPPPDIPLELEDDEELAAYVTRVLDGRTGLPIPGAVVRCYPERILDWLWRHDFLLAQGVVDERGYAQIAAEGWDGDAHWVASAPGYGPSHDYAVMPPEVIYLTPGVELGGRVLDPHGRPAAGVQVSCFHGCGHGPTVARATTDAAGMFTLSGLNPNEGRIWLEGEGIQADYFDLRELMGYGDRLHDLTTEPGHTATGRILDAAGEPISGVVVRSLQCHRGPAAVTDEQGRYRLIGVEPEHALYLHHPASLRPEGMSAPSTDAFDEGWVPGREWRLRLHPMRLLPPALATASVTARLVLPPGRAITEDDPVEVSVRFVSLDTGAVRWAVTEDDATDLPMDLPPGRWLIQPYGDFEELTFDPVRVTAVEGQPVSVELPLRTQPRLKIDGLPRFWQVLELVTDDEVHRENRDGGAAWSPFVAESGDLTLRLITRDESPMRYFRAGPVEADGTRRVSIRLPAPNRIRVIGGRGDLGRVYLYAADSADPQNLELDRQTEVQDGDEVFTTWATGPLILHVEAEAGAYRVPVDLPAGGGAFLDIDPRAAALTPDHTSLPMADEPGAAVITVREADGSTVFNAELERYYVEDGSVERGVDDVNGPIVLRRGSWIRVHRQGWRSFHVQWERAGAREVRWGSSTLSLRLLHWGDPHEYPSTIWVDDHAYGATGEAFELKGLAPGVHDVIIVPYDVSAAPRDDEDQIRPTGRRLRVKIAAGETKRLVVEVEPEEDDG